jgi:hypothetical protein
MMPTRYLPDVRTTYNRAISANELTRLEAVATAKVISIKSAA